MSDRQLRELLRRIASGDTEAIEPYVRAATRAGYSIYDIRATVRDAWVPYYEQISDLTEARALLAGDISILHYDNVIDWPSEGLSFADEPLMSQAEWYLWACECIERGLRWMNGHLAQQIAKVLEAVRSYYAVILASPDNGKARESARLDVIMESWELRRLREIEEQNWWAGPLGSYHMCGAAALVADIPIRVRLFTIVRILEHVIRACAEAHGGNLDDCYGESEWQRQRLADYLLGLSALPPPEGL